jgi:hypothetical protein
MKSLLVYEEMVKNLGVGLLQVLPFGNQIAGILPMKMD